MSKVVLVNPPLENKARLYKELSEVKIVYPPLGLLYLAGSLRRAGHEVAIVDLETHPGSMRAGAGRVLAEKPDYIGMTATTVAIGNAAKLAGEIKNRERKVPIVLGGVHVTAVPERTLKRFPWFDLGVVGEGEKTLAELVAALEKGKSVEKIPGLAMRKGSRILVTRARNLVSELDSLALPAFDLLPDVSAYGGSQFIEFEKRPTFRLVTSRGCPFRCWFCARSVFGNRLRTHSPEYVMKMVRILYREYGIRQIYFSDDTFTVDKERAREICRLLIREKLDLTWDCNARVDTVDLALLKLMRRAGCTYIAYGIESGNEEILKILNKGITLEQVRKTCEWTREAGIKIRGNFMMANPGETRETMEETIELAKSLPLFTFKMAFFTPFPGTELYRRAGEFGEYKEDWSKLSKYSPVFIPRGLSLEEIETGYKRAYLEFYFRPKMVWSYLAGIKSLGQLRLALNNFFTLSKFLFSKIWSKFNLQSKRWKGLKPLFTIGITVVIFGLLLSRMQWAVLVKALAMADKRILVLALVISVGHNIFGVTDKWRRILAALGFALPYRSLLWGRVGSYAIRGILPLKSGEATRVAYVKKFHGVPIRVGTASVIIGIVLNIAVLLGLAAIGLAAGGSL